MLFGGLAPHIIPPPQSGPAARRSRVMLREDPGVRAPSVRAPGSGFAWGPGENTG